MSREFRMPERIVIGENALENSASHMASLGKKAFIITGPHVSKLDFFKTLERVLEKEKLDYTVFREITGEPTDTMVVAATKKYRETNCDFLIGLGGGSPLDAMKAMGVLLSLGGNISDYMGMMIEANLPPMVAIPTTAGTGSEVTKVSIITDTEKDVKMLLRGENMLPDLAIIDSRATLSSPPAVTAGTGIDALTHAVESYSSKLAQPMTDTLAISAVKRIFAYLPKAFQDGSDKKAREEMALAAMEAGICISNASVTIVHGMSRPIGALFHVPHGMSNAMLLADCLDFALDGCPSKFADLGRAIGLVGEDDSLVAKAFVEKVRELCRICKVPSPRDYGIEKEAFFAQVDKMAKDAILSGSPSNTIKTVTKEDMVKIYHGLWEK